MTLFNKLPGFVRTPPGQERVILRRLPRVLVFGSLLLALPSLLVRLLGTALSEGNIAGQIMTVDIYGISLIILHWTVVFTVAIAAFIVLVMKGPAYVADPYPLDEAEQPGPSGQQGGHGRC